jgi:glycine dehydrogenase
MTERDNSFNATEHNFVDRHIGVFKDHDQKELLSTLGYGAMGAFIKDVVPEEIYQPEPLGVEPALSEQEALVKLKSIAAKNAVNRSLIGQGYYGTITPPVIQRNILENPAWYTAYTPY